MSSSSYEVVFTGALREGVSRRDGISQLAQQLGLDFDRIKKLLAATRPVVKRGTQVSEGERLVQVFWEAGWHAELICEDCQKFSGEERAASVDVCNSDDDEDSENARQLFADDGSCSIGVPADWQPFKDLNRGALIQSGNLQENQFLVVLAQPRAELPVASTIGAYCGAQLNQCANKLCDAVVLTPATPLEEGDLRGYCGEISAKIDGIPVQYLVACLECEAQIYTLFFWCEAQLYRHRRRDFERMVLSFRTAPTSVAEQASDWRY